MSAMDQPQTRPTASNTRASTTQSCLKVSGTVELHEMILLHLPLRDLLRAQMVSKQWRAVWQQSTKIQQVLFFEPFGTTIEFVRLNPNDRLRTWVKRNGTELCGWPVINPFINRFVYAEPDEEGDGPWAYQILNQPLINTVSTESPRNPPRRHYLLHYTRASWRHMLFLQPANSSLHWVCFSQDLESQAHTEAEAGLTLDDIQSTFYGHLRTCLRCPLKDDGEPDRWRWLGATDTSLLSVDMTGHEVLAELEARCRT